MSDDESNSTATDGKQDVPNEKPRGPAFSYIDFWPKCLEKGGLMKAPVYESFSECFEQANVFLAVNTDWHVVNCETVERKQDADDDTVEAEAMTFQEDSKRVHCYVTGLRLWVKVKDVGEPPQRLGYLNFVPKAAQLTGKEKYPVFDTFTTTLQEINSYLKYNTIQGEIITVETRDLKYRGYWREGAIDPDQSSWFQLGREILYLFAFRVFYEVGEPKNETIGYQDFTPDKTGTEKVGLARTTVATYGDYKSLMSKARTWLSEHKDIRVTNLQTLDRKMKKAAKAIDMEKTFFVNGEPSDKVFIKSLRVAYVTPTEQPDSIDLRQRTLLPDNIIDSRKAMKKYSTETLKQTVEDGLPWFNKHPSCRVISVETLVAPVLKHVTEPQLVTCERFLAKYEFYQVYLRVFFDALNDDEPSDDETNDVTNQENNNGDGGDTDKKKEECCIQ